VGSAVPVGVAVSGASADAVGLGVARVADGLGDACGLADGDGVVATGGEGGDEGTDGATVGGAIGSGASRRAAPTATTPPIRASPSAARSRSAAARARTAEGLPGPVAVRHASTRAPTRAAGRPDEIARDAAHDALGDIRGDDLL
jgi:hypothetical protein